MRYILDIYSDNSTMDSFKYDLHELAGIEGENLVLCSSASKSLSNDEFRDFSIANRLKTPENVFDTELTNPKSGGYLGIKSSTLIDFIEKVPVTNATDFPELIGDACDIATALAGTENNCKVLTIDYTVASNTLYLGGRILWLIPLEYSNEEKICDYIDYLKIEIKKRVENIKNRKNNLKHENI